MAWVWARHGHCSRTLPVLLLHFSSTSDIAFSSLQSKGQGTSRQLHSCAEQLTHLYLTFGFNVSNCCCKSACTSEQRRSIHHDLNSLRPIASIAFVDGNAVGSSQHSNFAQGLVLTTSGGSTPILRQMNRPAVNDFNRDFNLHPAIL